MAARFTLTANLCVCLCALAIAQEINQTPSSDQSSTSPHAAHTADIKLHRWRHFDAKQNTEVDTLRSQCRYESEISTTPPQKVLSLTFDDGPEPGQTEHILEVLREHHIAATFFMIGEQAKKHPELVAKVLTEGHHLIANHSWDHPNFHDIDPAAQALQVEESELVLASDMKEKFFRYPYGNSSCETNEYLHKAGYKIVGWHIDSCDWAFDRTGSLDPKEAAICAVLPQFRNDYVGHVLSAIRAQNGGILLMHEIHPNTLKNLNEIIERALADGFSFESIDSPNFRKGLR